MQFTDLVTWTVRQVTERATTPTPAAYVALCPKERDSYPQRARVELEGTGDLAAALSEACGDLVRSAEAEDRSVTRIKVRVMAVKGSAELAALTFRVGAGRDDEGEPAAGDVRGETAALLRELRLLVSSQGDTIRQQSAGAFTLGLEALKGQAALHERIGELTGALIVAENANKSTLDSVKELIAPLAPVLPGLVMQLAAAMGPRPSLPPTSTTP